MDAQRYGATEEQSQTFDPETLDQLREDLNALLEQERRSFEALQNDFRLHLNLFCNQGQLIPPQGQLLDNNQWEFIRGLRTNLEQKSRNIGCLAQLGLKMIDYVTEQQYQQVLLCQKYQTALEELQYENGCLSSRNIHIENDVEYFRQRLQATESQLESIVTQESEQREEKDEAISSAVQSARDRQIEMLQQQLQKIREEIQQYKQSHHHHREHPPQEGRRSTYMRIRSEYNIHPESEVSTLNLHLMQYSKRIEALEGENIRLQRELDISQTKVRSRRNSKAAADIKESRLMIQLIPEMTGEETERKPEEEEGELLPLEEMQKEEKEEALEASPSAFSILHKGNLLGDIKESLQSSNSHMDASNRLICISSNRSLFANLELHDLVRQPSAFLNRPSMNSPKKLQLSSATMKEVVDRIPVKVRLASIGTQTDRIGHSDKSTMTYQQQQKSSFLKRVMLKPVQILVRMIWRGGWGLGCIG